MKKVKLFAIGIMATAFAMTSCSSDDEVITPKSTTGVRSVIVQNSPIYGLWKLDDPSKEYYMNVTTDAISTGTHSTRFDQTYHSISISDNEYVVPNGLVYKFIVEGDKLILHTPESQIWMQTVPEIDRGSSTLMFKKVELVANPLEGVWKGTNSPLYLMFTSDMKFSYGVDPINFNFKDIPYSIDANSQFTVTYEDGRKATQKFAIDGKNMTIEFLDQSQSPETYTKIY